MTAPNRIAFDDAIGGSSSVAIAIPTSGPGGTVIAGMKAILALDVTVAFPTADPTGWAPLQDTASLPTAGAGRLFLWETDIGSTGAVDPGDTVTVNLTGVARSILGIFITDGCGIVAAVVSPATGQTSGATPPFLVDAQTATAPDACRALWIYGGNATTGGNQNAWTAPAGTVERVDATTAHSTAKNPTLMFADEVVAAGATGTRTAEASVRIDRAAITVLLNVDVDRPICDVTASATTVFIGSNVDFTIAMSNGAGGPFTQELTHVSGPATPTINNATTTTPDVTFTVAGTYVLRAVGEDSASVESLPDDITITVTGAEDNVYPISDGTVTSWTGYGSGSFANLAARLADNSYSTGIQATDPTDLPFRFPMGPFTPPTGSEPYSTTVQAAFDSGSSATLVTRVMEGVTVIAEWEDTWAVGGGIMQEFIHFWTTAQIASVTDWDGLDAYGELTVVP